MDIGKLLRSRYSLGSQIGRPSRESHGERPSSRPLVLRQVRGTGSAGICWRNPAFLVARRRAAADETSQDN